MPSKDKVYDVYSISILLTLLSTDGVKVTRLFRWLDIWAFDFSTASREDGQVALVIGVVGWRSVCILREFKAAGLRSTICQGSAQPHVAQPPA